MEISLEELLIESYILILAILILITEILWITTLNQVLANINFEYYP